MRAWRVLAVLAALTLLGAVAVATEASARPRDRSSFTLVAFAVTENVPIERGLTFTDRLETVAGEAVDGWDGGRCINLDPDPEALTQWMCELVVHLPEGAITAAGPFDIGAVVGDDWEIVFAVTGGTGAFNNARGEIVIAPRPDADVGVLVHFRLIGASARY